MKKKLFGIILIVVIVAVTYFYMKGKRLGTPGATGKPGTAPVYNPNVVNEEEEKRKIRVVAENCYKDLKGWSVLHPEPYKPVVKFNTEQFAYFLEFYPTLYRKGFKHHINNQSAAWNRNRELYQLKLELNRKLV